VVDEEAAEQRPDHGRDAEHGAEEALVLAPLAGRDDVADGGDRRDDQPPAAEALDRAERDQLAHVLREAAKSRADEEDHDRHLEHDPPSVEVSELPVDRADDRRGEQVRGDDPREVLDPAEVADDRRQRRRDDRLVERGQEEDEHQRPEDETDARRVLARRRCGRVGGDAHHGMMAVGHGERVAVAASRGSRPPVSAGDGGGRVAHELLEKGTDRG
jgi:hypothetical protein